MNATYCLWRFTQTAVGCYRGTRERVSYSNSCTMSFNILCQNFIFLLMLPFNSMNYEWIFSFIASSRHSVLLGYKKKNGAQKKGRSFFPLYFALAFVFCTATQLTEGLEEANSKLTISGYFSREWKEKKCNFWHSLNWNWCRDQNWSD